MQKLLRLPQVIERTSLRRSTIYEKMSDGSFPKPVKLNRRANGWVEDEISNWIEARMAARGVAR
jgi:prophage regulatory protein